MSEYLAPGVFVEEVSFRAKSIEGVGTSVAAIVGPTRFGPLRGKPEVVTSFGEFSRIYGDIQNLSLGGSSVLNHTAIAAKAFFDGGGKQLFVARAGNFATPTTGFAAAADAAGAVTFSSRFPGSMGNFTLELEWSDSENLLRRDALSAPAEGEVVLLEASGLSNAIRAAGANVVARVPDAAFPLAIRAVVRRAGDHFVIVNNLCDITPAAGSLGGTDFRPDAGNPGDEGFLMSAGLVSGGGVSVNYHRVTLKSPTSGSLANGAAAVLTLNAATDLSDFTGGSWGTNSTIYGTLDMDNGEFDVSAAPINPGVAAFSFPLAALAAAPNSVRAIMVQRSFDLSVRSGGANGPVIYSYGNISTAPTGPDSLAAKLAQTPEKRQDQLSSPVSCTLDDGISGTDVMDALMELFDPSAMNPTGISVSGPRYLITLSGGNDGDAPAAVHYGGVSDEVNGSTGFVSLEDIEDVSIVMTPAAAADAVNHQAIVAEMQKHCLRMRYRVGIVDSRADMSLAEIREFRSNFDDSRLALYYPWVVIADPRGIATTITAPPAGFIAGVYANTDVQRGVHKPPANEIVIGALRFAQDINRFQQELLNPNGINCLRSFPGRGHRVWGGRTLSSDPEWKYVNVRRYFLYLERSIDKSTQWVVFEPNGEALWDNVRATVESFLYNEWRNGRLLGSEKSAYFVRCDRSTMTQNDIDNGRLVCEIGVAALKPAEFVIFRIGQKTADA
ncbi:MAG: phage tail sheath subtilisin-like domain-containing protein [Gammaproteobacteria bacterium]|nr:phage tail sheath subtilisin-like domain-containing protein [Gammaproteobacteria bacterium]